MSTFTNIIIYISILTKFNVPGLILKLKYVRITFVLRIYSISNYIYHFLSFRYFFRINRLVTATNRLMAVRSSYL